MLRRWSVLALVTLLLWGASGCGSESSAPPRLESERLRDSAQKMLHERAARLAAGDVEGYLHPLSPEARESEEPVARAAASMPLAEIDLVLGEADVDAAEKTLRSSEIDFVYRYKDIPEDNPFRFRMVATLTERDGTWLVTSSGYDVSEAPLPPWATGPVEIARSDHFLALHRPGLAEVQKVLGVAEQARAELAPKLTLEPDDRHVLLLARDVPELATMIIGLAPGGASGVVALAAVKFEASVAYGERPENRFLAVNVGRVFEERSAPLHPLVDALQRTPMQVFTHELGHLALARFTRAATPPWVTEGAAMLLSGERLEQAWRFLLPIDPVSISAMTRAEALAAEDYPYANAAVLFLVERFGSQQFWEFYRNFKDFEVMGDLREARGAATHRLLRRFYDIDERALDALVHEWMVNGASP
jgi:hypothetical protein